MSRINDVIEFYLQYCKPLQILGGGFKHFSFTPTWGRFPFLWAYFSTGWFNHQLAIFTHQWKKKPQVWCSGCLGPSFINGDGDFGAKQLTNDTVDGSEIPNNHLGCIKQNVDNGIKYQPQLVLAGFQPSTVRNGWDPNKNWSCRLRWSDFCAYWLVEENLSAIQGSRETRWLSTQETVHQGGVSGWFSHISSFVSSNKVQRFVLGNLWMV